MSIEISVIVPVYNGGTLLRKCLDSVLAQQNCIWELICVDDGSSDNSVETLNEYAARDSRIRIYLQSNRGVATTRNRAMREAKGEYAAFLDCDDYYPADDVLAKLYRAAVRNGAGICGGSLMEVWADGRTDTEFTGKRAGLQFRNEGWIDFGEFAFEYAFQRYLYKMDFLRKNQIEFPPYTVFEDPVFLVKAMIAAKRFYAIPEVVYAYRRRDSLPEYSVAKIHDLASAGTEILRLTAGREEYRKLFDKYVRDFFGDFSEGDHNAVGNLCVRQLLADDTELACILFRATETLSGRELLPPLRKIAGGKAGRFTKNDVQSAAWRNVCRTYARRERVRGLIRCLRENGVIYTLKRIVGR